MLVKESGVFLEDLEVGLDPEIDPLPEQFAVVINGRMRIAEVGVGLVVAASGTQIADAAGRAAALGPLQRAL